MLDAVHAILAGLLFLSAMVLAGQAAQAAVAAYEKRKK